MGAIGGGDWGVREERTDRTRVLPFPFTEHDRLPVPK